MNGLERLNVAFASMAAEDPDLFGALFNRDGTASQAQWSCEDGWIVSYTTERIKGGPFDGRFAVMVYKPIGRGARTNKAHEWQRVSFTGYAKRRTARARADAIYYKHSPKAAIRHGIL